MTTGRSRYTRFAVVRLDNGIDNPHTGVVSNHRTVEAARAKIERDNVSLRREPGYALAWHPYGVWDRHTDEVTR